MSKTSAFCIHKNCHVDTCHCHTTYRVVIMVAVEALKKIVPLMVFIAVVRKQKWARHNRRRKYIKRKIRKVNMQRDRVQVENEIRYMEDTDFKQMFRIDKGAFEVLLNKVKTALPEPNSSMSSRAIPGNMGQPLTVRTKLAATLRYLAGRHTCCLLYDDNNKLCFKQYC